MDHDFRYDLFPLAAAVKDKYAARVARGYSTAAETEIVICGLARNIASVVHKTISRVEKLRGMFRNSRVIILENDSSDATPYALTGWQHSSPGVTATCKKLNEPVNRSNRCLQRATRMASYRNMLRKLVVADSGDLPYVIVVDTDIAGGWSPEGIASTFGQEQAWDFVGSNGIMFRQYGGKGMIPCHYDVWAFRWAGDDTPCRPEQINPRHWARGSEMVPVNSCFGGLGIYRMEAFKQCSYDGTDCEHVPFHRKMREAGMGRLFMNPSQIVLYNNEKFDTEFAVAAGRDRGSYRR